MKMSVYLSNAIIAELTAHGPLDEVVDSILQLGADGQIDLEQRPKCGPRGEDRRIDIEITNLYYLELLTHYPQNSTQISLRRLLYWFVENDLCELLPPPRDDRRRKFDSKFDYIMRETRTLLDDIAQSQLQVPYHNHLQDAYNTLKEGAKCKI